MPQEYVVKSEQEQASNRMLALGVYGLQLVGLFTFVGFIAGVVINYIKFPSVQGTWLESHFRWQMRTFWYGLLWSVIGGILIILLVGYLILLANYIWMIYRIIKGWLNLISRQEMIFY